MRDPRTFCSIPRIAERLISVLRQYVFVRLRSEIELIIVAGITSTFMAVLLYYYIRHRWELRRRRDEHGGNLLHTKVQSVHAW